MTKGKRHMMKNSVFYDHILQAVEQTGRNSTELLKACRELGIQEQYRLIGEDDESRQEGMLYRRHCRGLAGVAAGDGYPPIGERLELQGYNGYLAIEYFDVIDQMGHIRRSADFLKKHIGREAGL